MSIKTRLFVGFLVIGIFIAIIGVISIFQFENTLENLIVLDNNIKNLNRSQNLLSYAIDIRYYDEVLTQSARNYAFTENEMWKLKYFDTEPLLSHELDTAAKLGSSIEKEFFMQITDANNSLVEMELNAMNLVDSGNADEAVSILDSQEYWKHKEDYQNSLMKYLESRNLEHSALLMESPKDVDASIRTVFETTNSWKFTVGDPQEL